MNPPQKVQRFTIIFEKPVRVRGTGTHGGGPVRGQLFHIVVATIFSLQQRTKNLAFCKQNFKIVRSDITASVIICFSESQLVFHKKLHICVHSGDFGYGHE